MPSAFSVTDTMNPTTRPASVPLGSLARTLKATTRVSAMVTVVMAIFSRPESESLRTRTPTGTPARPASAQGATRRTGSSPPVLGDYEDEQRERHAVYDDDDGLRVEDEQQNRNRGHADSEPDGGEDGRPGEQRQGGDDGLGQAGQCLLARF